MSPSAVIAGWTMPSLRKSCVHSTVPSAGATPIAPTPFSCTICLTPSIVASLARFLRPLAKERGDEMESAFGDEFRFYSRWIEPVEWTLCSVWPSLLAFQLVVVALPSERRRRGLGGGSAANLERGDRSVT